MLLGIWLMLVVYSLSVLGSCMSDCWCLFLRMVVRQRYGGRRRGLGLGLYRWTTSGLLGIKRMDKARKDR